MTAILSASDLAEMRRVANTCLLDTCTLVFPNAPTEDDILVGRTAAVPTAVTSPCQLVYLRSSQRGGITLAPLEDEGSYTFKLPHGINVDGLVKVQYTGPNGPAGDYELTRPPITSEQTPYVLLVTDLMR